MRAWVGFEGMQSCGEGACCAMMKKVEDKVTSFALWFFFFFWVRVRGFYRTARVSLGGLSVGGFDVSEDHVMT